MTSNMQNSPLHLQNENYTYPTMTTTRVALCLLFAFLFYGIYISIAFHFSFIFFFSLSRMQTCLNSYYTHSCKNIDIPDINCYYALYVNLDQRIKLLHLVLLNKIFLTVILVVYVNLVLLKYSIYKLINQVPKEWATIFTTKFLLITHFYRFLSLMIIISLITFIFFSFLFKSYLLAKRICLRWYFETKKRNNFFYYILNSYLIFIKLLKIRIY